MSSRLPGALLIASGIIALGARSHTVPSVTIVRVPDGGIQPQTAVDSAGSVHLVYFKGDPAHGDVFYTRAAGDGSFSAAIQVNSEPRSAIATGTVRGAHIALGRNGRVHVQWMGSSETHAAAAPAPAYYTRLADDGRRFEPQYNVMRNPAIGPDGGSVAADSTGHVYVIWHALSPGGKGEADRRLWVAASDDDGRTFAAERAISDPAFGACGCCGTGAFALPDGTLYALFRAAREGVHRDTFLLRSTDHGATFGHIDVGPWDINACPMSTYAFAEGRLHGDWAAAWETDGRVYWSRVPLPAAQSVAARQAGGDVKNQKHPSIAVNARGETLVVWTEGMGWNKGGALAWQIFDEDLNYVGPRGSAAGVPSWDLPAAYARADGSFVILY